VERIRVATSREYDVLIGGGILNTLGERMKDLVKGRNCMILADDNTSPLFGETVRKSLEAEGFKTIEYTIPHGEESKSADNFVEILNFLAENKLTRSDCIVALGGGVVGDLAGFVASSFLRGIAFVQVPTTLLAAVDSSVGGKTAINLRAGKNLAGAFYQPCLCLCDTDIIKNLPDDIFADGMAEVIKYGAIRSTKILELVKSGAHENLDEIIAECVTIKRDVVSEDEFDTGLRQLLNFGHTPAHAIEKLSDFRISHGKAVAAGMCIMARAAENMKLCEAGVADELTELCRSFNLPTSCEFSPEAMVEVAMSDKKRGAGYITLVVPVYRGNSVLFKVSDSEIIKYFSSGAEERR